MSRRRAIGRLLMIIGAAVLGFLAYQTGDPRMNAASITTFGMPGTLLVGLGAIVLFSIGAGL